ncbi:MAG: hypothetical protein HY783_10890 [Chloroflexi bacterium]|nr:hypothetical protein [Chloroflexota bacterium]
MAFWLVHVPGAYLLGVVALVGFGVQVARAVDFCLRWGLLMQRCRPGDWKRNEL